MSKAKDLIQMVEAIKDTGEPDGTGPHGRGAGPGQGKGDGSGKDIDRDKVEDASIRAAEDIFGEADKEWVSRIVDAAVEKAKDTEDAIQIAINMMRG